MYLLDVVKPSILDHFFDIKGDKYCKKMNGIFHSFGKI